MYFPIVWWHDGSSCTHAVFRVCSLVLFNQELLFLRSQGYISRLPVSSRPPRFSNHVLNPRYFTLNFVICLRPSVTSSTKRHMFHLRLQGTLVLRFVWLRTTLPEA
jgi:hypothetical protein